MYIHDVAPGYAKVSLCSSKSLKGQHYHLSILQPGYRRQQLRYLKPSPRNLAICSSKVLYRTQGRRHMVPTMVGSIGGSSACHANGSPDRAGLAIEIAGFVMLQGWLAFNVGLGGIEGHDLHARILASPVELKAHSVLVGLMLSMQPNLLWSSGPAVTYLNTNSAHQKDLC